MHGLAQDGDEPYALTGERPIAGRLFSSLQLINSAVDARTNPIYHRHGIHRADYPVLDALARHRPTHVLAPTELARRLAITTGALTPRLDRLEAAGLIQRLSVPRDRRRLHIRLTPAGRRCVQAVGLDLSSHLQETVQSMGKNQLVELASLLKALERCLRT
ncbi:DNA-binding MarR family transcriptional regulator [Streptomyces sp. SAI-126]|uniref:MarR family winged helix-turn-helix transcriptional regulator n=1 Tax=unclassified Streptomyces TaxID=2593676 RepID=UPI0036E159AD